MTDITRPIIGIENRSAQEVFDIMVDRIRSVPAAIAVETKPVGDWVMVPREPTTEMLSAYHRAKHEGPKPTLIPDLWSAMLAAAAADLAGVSPITKLAYCFQSIMSETLTVDPADNEIMGTGKASFLMARAALSGGKAVGDWTAIQRIVDDYASGNEDSSMALARIIDTLGDTVRKVGAGHEPKVNDDQSSAQETQNSQKFTTSNSQEAGDQVPSNSVTRRELAKLIMLEVQFHEFGALDTATGDFTCSSAQVEMLETVCNKAADRILSALSFGEVL